MHSVGQQLKEAREAKKLTLQEAASRTQIKVQQLEALERDDFSAMPAPVYTKGFIKLYAKTVGLDGPSLVELYQASQREAELPDVEVGTEVLDKKPLIERDEEDRAATITRQKSTALSGGSEKFTNISGPDWMMYVGRYLPLLGALVVVLLLWFGLRSFFGSTGQVESLDAQLFESVSPLVAEPPEPYLKLE